MRILLFSGKGGVGKTSIAAATGLQVSRLGYRTLVMSVDPAHSLADSFDLETGLFHAETSDPLPITENLSIHEVNIQKEIKRHWAEISSYVVSVLRTTGISDVEAEELAILPGMEELSAMMYINQFRRENRYDVIVLDSAPTAESMRFVSMPTTLEWYMKHIFPFQRGLLKAVRPLANRVSPVELPTDNYFANIQSLFGRLEGIGELLEDPRITSVRLVTNPEKMVLRETQRAFVYFSLHGLTVDAIIVNRVLPEEVTDAWFQEWRAFAAQDPGRNRILLRAGAGEARAAVHARGAGTRAPGRTGQGALRARARTPPRSLAPKRPTASPSATGTTKCGSCCRSPPRGRWGCSRRATNWWWRSERCAGTSDCRCRWPGLSPARARLENKILTVEMREA